MFDFIGDAVSGIGDWLGGGGGGPTSSIGPGGCIPSSEFDPLPTGPSPSSGGILERAWDALSGIDPSAAGTGGASSWVLDGLDGMSGGGGGGRSPRSRPSPRNGIGPDAAGTGGGWGFGDYPVFDGLSGLGDAAGTGRPMDSGGFSGGAAGTGGAMDWLLPGPGDLIHTLM